MGLLSSAWYWLTQHKNGVMNVLSVAAPIAVGVAQGHVITPETLITAGGVLVAKLAASPIDHSETPEDKVATATQEKKAAAGTP